MPVEIERKFLVTNDAWKADAPHGGVHYVQGYIAHGREHTVRVRIAGMRGYLTIKGVTTGMSRSEFEYEIPIADATDMLNTMCHGRMIDKFRYRIPAGNITWEIDEFHGENAGLVIAEVELLNESQHVPLPTWVGREVTIEQKYTNASLAARPWLHW